MNSLFNKAAEAKTSSLVKQLREETKQKVLKAADIIEERGLANGTLLTPEGRVCLLGGLALANGETQHSILNRSSHDKTRDSLLGKVVHEALKNRRKSSIVGFSDGRFIDEPNRIRATMAVVSELRKIAATL